MTAGRLRRTSPLTAVAIVVLATLAAACSESGGTTSGEPPASTASLAPTTTLGPAPFDDAALAELSTYAGETGSNCLLVQRGGEVVYEQYYNGTNAETQQEIFSASKSVSSTLVGIAEKEGHLQIDEPASKYIPQWQGTPSESVTIRDLLSNISGRYQDNQSDYVQMAARAPNKTEFSINLSQQHPPGTFWEYNNAAIQTLEAVLENATGEDVEEFAKSRLFEPLGMKSTIFRDNAGNPLTFMGVQASCRDLASFGQFALQQGEWNGEKLVEDDWFAQATSPSSELNHAYGFLWWLNRPGLVKLPVVGERQGPLWKSAPEDSFAALGLGGQIVAVFPDEQLVVIRLASGRGGTVQSQENFVEEAARILLT
jgi:CubicO group peptidase (beta-lactamase class C family)